MDDLIEKLKNSEIGKIVIVLLLAVLFVFRPFGNSQDTAGNSSEEVTQNYSNVEDVDTTETTYNTVEDVDTNKNTEDTVEDVDATENTDNTIEVIDITENTENTENTVEDVGTTENTKNTVEDVETTENTKNTVKDVETTENTDNAVEDTDTDKNTNGLTFRSDYYLQQHYQKHGIDMGFSSASEYEQAAAAVVSNPKALHKTEAEDGDDIYYIESTNEFVVVSTDGYIRTYFCPDSGISYYNRQ